MRVLRSNGGTAVELETVKLTLDATLEPLRRITSLRRGPARSGCALCSRNQWAARLTVIETLAAVSALCSSA
jgi:hypothetical protein